MGKLILVEDIQDIPLGDEDKETETITYEKIKGRTEKSALFVIDDEDVFVPRSQIHSANEKEKTIEVSCWWCEKNGLV